MSRDSQYRHRLWHTEDPTLSIRSTRLELLVDFDPPSRFTVPPNCSQLSGIRPTFVVSRTPGATVAPGERGVGAFGRVGGAGRDREDPTVTQWRELGVPPMTSE